MWQSTVLCVICVRTVNLLSFDCATDSTLQGPDVINRLLMTSRPCHRPK